MNKYSGVIYQTSTKQRCYNLLDLFVYNVGLMWVDAKKGFCIK